MLVIVLPALIAVTGLTVDWGHGVWVRTELQKAADAGALAGATRLPCTVTAEADANAMVLANFDGPDQVALLPLGTHYQVDLAESVPTMFMGLFGHNTMEVSVTAKAVIKRPIGGMRGGTFPFAILNPEHNNEPADDFVPGNYGRRYIIMYGEDNIMVPDWVNGHASLPDEVDGNSRGWRGALKLDADGSQTGDAGAGDLAYNMVNGWPGTSTIGDTLLTQCGNINNIVNRARNDLLGGTPVSWEEFDPRIHNDCSRVVMVPIVHMVNVARQDTYTGQDYLNGAAYEHDFVVIDGYAPFFILTVAEQGDVDGDGHANDRDWVTGHFVPGVQTQNFLPPVPGNPNFGLYSPPRLVD